jgi:single-strand DNA-binding protein
MNKVILMGRLTRDPEVRYGGANNTAIARISLAVDRRFKREGQPDADFFNCTAFGKTGEFVEKYLRKGTKVVLDGEIQNDNYEKDGVKHYSTQIIINTIEFAESKKAAESNDGYVPRSDDAAPSSVAGDDFMNIPDIAGDDKVPF